MNRMKKILKNTIAYTIGNFGSKILAYVMVLVYTHYITKADLGYYDLILTTVSLLQPIVLLMLDDGAYRWLVDDSIQNKRSVLSTCIKTAIITTIVSTIVFLAINLKLQVKYVWLIILYFATGIIYQIVLNSVRGLSNSRLYAESGILNSIIVLIFEMIGLMIFKLGIEALLISKVLANIFSVIFLYKHQKEFCGIALEKYDGNLIREILHYSLPLIPNNIGWWVVNSSDRYVILFFLGASFNGIYSIANKFPTVVTVITGILYLSLQESMLKEYNSPDRDHFYSEIYIRFIRFIFPIAMCGIPATRIVLELFAGLEYREAWMYSGFLFLSTVYSSLSGLLGIGYQISRETKRSVVSTVGAVLVNVVINISLIKSIGLYAASFSTLLSYMFLFFVRIIHSKKYYKININWLEFVTYNILSVIIIYLTFVLKGILPIVGLTMICTSVLLISNKGIALSLYHKIQEKLFN